MSIKHIKVDIPNAVKELTDSGISKKQAEAISRVLTESLETHEDLATRNDLQLLDFSIKKDIAETKADIIKWVAGMLVAQVAIVATLIKLL